MHPSSRTSTSIVLAFALSLASLLPASPFLAAQAQAQARAQGEARSYDQEILGPGLYAYQTRVREATCGDDSQTGFVSTFMGSINGIPGSRSMEMKLINNRYWPEWTITVRPDGTVVGAARVSGETREAGFEVRRDEGRFVGTGSRTYQTTINGERRNCTVHVDVLLRRFDV